MAVSLPYRRDLKMLNVEIGIFAHNEEANVASFLDSLYSQDIFQSEMFSVNVYLLANGCTDATVERAGAYFLSRYVDFPLTILNLDKGGKSRTWNYFVHQASSIIADYHIFIDCDISMPSASTLRSMVKFIDENAALDVSSSRAVKDISYFRRRLTFVERIISASGGQLDDWETSVCGQLYVLRSSVARQIYLPIGLPVEDGFLRAMVLTNQLEDSEDLSRIGGLDGIFHLYVSETRVVDVVRHQVRIVIGSAINAAIFKYLHGLNDGKVSDELLRASRDEDWVKGVCNRMLPDRRFGWVPPHFLFKRVIRARKFTGRTTLKGAVLLALGFGFDALVYLIAQFKMSRGVNAGHW